MFRKHLSRTIYSSFFFENSETYRFFLNYLHDSTSIFRGGGIIISEGFSGRTVRERMWECLRQERDIVKRFREQAEEESGNSGSVAAGIASQRVLGGRLMLQ